MEQGAPLLSLNENLFKKPDLVQNKKKSTLSNKCVVFNVFITKTK